MRFLQHRSVLFFLLLNLSILPLYSTDTEVPVLHRWEPKGWDNFGDALSQPIVERILGRKIERVTRPDQKRLLAVGSILHSARNGDVIWGTGLMTKWFPDHITQLDVRAVRGPLTRDTLLARGVPCPEVYGDPALLLPILFPEFKPNPIRDYIIIPHASETGLFRDDPHFVSPRDPWEVVVRKILESKFVISSSLHGIIVAEAYGIPARMLLCTNKSQLRKYEDYYLGTGRPKFKYATSIEQALRMGGEKPALFDADKLLKSFPSDLWKGK
jgi:pyruvyltransferase